MDENDSQESTGGNQDVMEGTMDMEELLTDYPDTQREGKVSRYPQSNRRASEYYSPDTGMAAKEEILTDNFESDPETLEDALGSPDAEQCKAALSSELESLMKHRTWEVVFRPEGVRELPGKLIFLRKRDRDGKVVRHKARLVVKGYLQGDVDHTFAPVVDFATVRTCLAIAVSTGYIIRQMDVKTAFLHDELEEELYLRAPLGLNSCRKDQNLRLRRGLYGLKQATRLWMEKWRDVMKSVGFRRMKADECLY